ncbi:rhomboid family intramembrane serine protease [Candidatus Woesearchaeota archaeon]|nr:rhomboid family intramembrane serine protease [Candidatus Woesearchaeota archaeon]
MEAVSRTRGFLQNATIPIILVNIVMFVLQVAVKGFSEMFILVSQDVLSRPWILVTSMFMHASPTHLFVNMYVLLMFGSLIEQRIGTKRFLMAYFASGLLASVAAAFFYNAALGASGAVMGILGVTIMLMPDLRVLFLFVIPMSLRTAGIIFVIIDVLGAFGIGLPGIANVAHLAGLAAGFGFGFYLLRKKRQFREKFTRPKKPAHSVKRDVNKGTHMSKEELEEYLKHGRL